MNDQSWNPQEPPDDFADRVMATIEADERQVRPPVPLRPRGWRARPIAAAGAFLAMAAGVALFLQMDKPTSGDIRAEGRQEAALGSRVVAVLEPGAHVSWQGRDVKQDHGSVFYRVERGGPLVVHTPSGDVTVHGTCFRISMDGEAQMNLRDVKAAAIGALATGLATVAVYEGHATVSHAGQSQALSAGQSATLDSNGVHTEGTNDPGTAGSAPGATGDDPLAQANRNLVESVHDYQTRLASIESAKTDLEHRLAVAQDKLAHNGTDGGVQKDPFDLDQDDLTRLAKSGTVKYRLPCSEPDWSPSAKNLNRAGLAPSDGPIVAAAWKKTNDVAWATIQPLCAKALGSTMEVAAQLGSDVCVSLLIKENKDETVYKEVAEMRAGIRPMAAPGDHTNPVALALLAQANEAKTLETELTPSFGPETAHRLANSDDLGCYSTHSHGSE
jgi:hypothetical protein